MSVVIPTLNEERNLPFVLNLIPQWVDEVIIVDGFSVDGTVAEARARRADARILSVDKRGKGHALRAGFEAAQGDIVVAMDPDGSTDPRELPAFVGALLSGADIALGSRFAVGGGTSDMEFHRRVGNHVLRHLVQLAFGVRYSDLCYGYMAFWRDVLPAVDGPHSGFDVETMVHIRARQHRLRVTEVPSFEARRLSGTSNLRAVRDGFSVLQTILKERRKGLPRDGRHVGQRGARSFVAPPWTVVDMDLTPTRSEHGL